MENKKVKLNFISVTEIKPKFISSNEPLSVEIVCELNEHRAQDFIYRLWNDFGDGIFNKVLEAENCVFIDKNKS